jgi:hypothetical protein
MKTAERDNRNRWADMFSVCANGTAGRNRRCSSTWGWKQEKLQRWERYFLLTSPSIERLSGASSKLGMKRVKIRILELAFRLPNWSAAEMCLDALFSPSYSQKSCVEE